MIEKRREDLLVERLGELRAAASELKASPQAKTRVMDAYRQAHAAHRERRMAAWLPALAAAACILCVLGAVWYLGGDAPAPLAPAAKILPPVAPSQYPAVAQAKPTKPSATPRKATARRASRPTAPRRQPEFATDFLMLPFAPPLDASEGGQVIRVSLPRSAMQTVGLPVNEDRWYERVPADVLLGQDGVARAVRFVSFSQ